MYAKPNYRLIKEVPEIAELRIQVTDLKELKGDAATFAGVVTVAAGKYYVKYYSLMWAVGHFDFVNEPVVIPLIL